MRGVVEEVYQAQLSSGGSGANTIWLKYYLTWVFEAGSSVSRRAAFLAGKTTSLVCSA